jgi:hypothetical protein
MKLILPLLFIVLAAGTLLSCKKKNTPAVPDVGNFYFVDPGMFRPNERGSVTVNSTTLADGNYTIYYFMFPEGYVEPMLHRISSQATLVMSNHTGTFKTEPLGTPYFMVIQADSLVNSSGGGVSINRLATLVDSTGMMKVQANGADLLSTFSVTAKPNGASIELLAESPVVGGMAQYHFVDLYLAANVGVQSINNLSSYGGFTNNATWMKNFVAGEVTITTLAPLLTGSFSVTCSDSTKMSATFSCPAP